MLNKFIRIQEEDHELVVNLESVTCVINDGDGAVSIFYMGDGDPTILTTTADAFWQYITKVSSIPPITIASQSAPIQGIEDSVRGQ